MNRILVTGGTGFIGRHLCPMLVRSGFDVSVATRNPPLAARIPDVHVQPIAADGSRIDWGPALRNIDAVIHLAGRVPDAHDLENDDIARLYHRANVEAADSLAADAVAAGVERFLLISTAKVHGESSAAHTAFTEADAPNPGSLYAASKWQAEQTVAKAILRAATELTILRPPVVYGPEVKGGVLALMRLCCRAPVLPLGRIGNRMSLISVGNLVDAIQRVLVDPDPTGGTYLISDGEDVSTTELVRTLARACGRRPVLFPCHRAVLSAIARLAGRRAAIDRLTSSFCVDSSRFRRRFQWTAPTDVRSGLAATAAWWAMESGRL